MSEKKKRYSTFWRNKWLTADAKTFDEMIEALRAAAYDLEKMKTAGIMLNADGMGDDYAELYTFDGSLANEFDLHLDEFDEECEDEEEDCGADQDT